MNKDYILQPKKKKKKTWKCNTATTKSYIFKANIGSLE